KGLRAIEPPCFPTLTFQPGSLHENRRFHLRPRRPAGCGSCSRAAADADAATRQTAQYLADLLARTRGLHLKVKVGAAPRGAIVLSREAAAPVAQAEGYALDVTPEGIRVTARDD